MTENETLVGRESTASTVNRAMRIVRATRLAVDIGHADIIDALTHAKEMQVALKVIHTWATKPEWLDAKQVRKLTSEALHLPDKALEE